MFLFWNWNSLIGKWLIGFIKETFEEDFGLVVKFLK